MKVTFLGTGCALVLKRYNTCFLMEEGDRKLLVDAGGGNEILVRLDKLGVKITDIGGMFVSHSHTDHILGTPWVIRAVGTAMTEQGYEGNFTVAACKETLGHVRSICEMTLGKKFTKLFDSRIFFREVSDGEEIDLAGFRLHCFDIGSKENEAVRLLHRPAGRPPVLPWRRAAEGNQRTICQGSQVAVQRGLLSVRRPGYLQAL